MGWIKMLCAIAILVILPVSACARMETVRIGTEGAYPPFAYINDDGQLEGFELELGDELCHRAQLKCEWVINDWDSIIPNLLEGKYDVIMAAMSITEERDEVIDFTQPYSPPEASVYVALAGASDEAINGKVAVQTATIQADYLDGKVAALLEYPLAEDTIDAVLNGEADATLAAESYLKDIVANSGGKLEFVGPEVMHDNGSGIGVREEDSELKEKLNEAISSMKADGSLNELIRKWFGEDADTF